MSLSKILFYLFGKKKKRKRLSKSYSRHKATLFLKDIPNGRSSMQNMPITIPRPDNRQPKRQTILTYESRHIERWRMQDTPALTESCITGIFNTFGGGIRGAGCDDRIVLTGERVPHGAETCAAVETVEEVFPTEFCVVLHLGDQEGVQFLFVDRVVFILWRS